MQWITFGGISNLPTVAEGAVYTELAVDDVKEADPWVTKGGYVGISRKMLKNTDIQIDVHLGTGGTAAATIWTCDLTAEYVRINGEYRT